MNRILGFVFFLSMVVLIVGGLHLYFWFRLVRDPALPGAWRLGSTILLTLMALSLPVSFILSRTLPLSLARLLLFPSYVWMGLMLILFSVLLCSEAVRLGCWLVHWFAGGIFVTPQARLLFSRGVALVAICLALGLTAVAIAQALRRPMVRKLTFALKSWPAALNGFRIVQLTDLHLGALLGQQWLSQVVARVNALSPDLIAITGDLVDGDVEQLSPVVELLVQLRARRGIYFVTGNHEYYSGVERWLPKLRALNIQVLTNQLVTIGVSGASFELAGIPDPSATRIDPEHGPDLRRALQGHDPTRALILLAHQPRAVLEAAEQGVTLQLSGHTHGGQIWPWNYFVYLQQPYLAGLVDHQGTKLYISEGTGFWGPPMRLGTRSEITLITIQAGSG